MTVAAVRPDDWNFPLLLHVLGAILLVGALLTVASALLLAWLRDDAGAPLLNRLAFRSFVLGVLPAYVLMRLAGQWVASKENVDDADFAWIEIGYFVSDLGLIVLLATGILAYLGAREGARGGNPLSRAAGVLACVLLAAFLVALWAMTTKPI